MVHAQVAPLVKKPGLSITDLANYKLISNLSTTIKVLDRLFLASLLPHIAPSLYPLHPAYRKLDSTETALFHIVNDIFEAVDHGRTTILVTLDLSITFDNTDHSILLNRLKALSELY